MCGAHQILSNPVSNAAKYSPPEAGVAVTARRAGGDVMFEVTDQGEPVPDHLRDRIFEMFFQAEPTATRGVGDLGVGSHVVRGLSDAMGATVRFDNDPGRGNRLRVSFPAAKTPATDGC